MHETALPEAGLIFNDSMMVSGVILLITFLAIFTENFHKVHRTKVSMLGAGIMLFAGQIFGFFSPELAIKSIDWNVIFLVGAMMAFVNVMVPTGGFEAIAYWVARLCGGRPFLLMTMMGTAIAVLSMFLNNLTTVVIFAPLIVLICQVVGISPLPQLIAASLFSNVGGVATLVGDPPNLMIGSAAGIDFMPFFEHMGPVILLAHIATIATMYLVFLKTWKKKKAETHFAGELVIADRRTWYTSLAILAVMIVLFVFSSSLGWDAWVVSALGLTLLFLFDKEEHIDPYLEKVELSLLLFFIALFILVGGVEHSQLLVYLGQKLEPLVQQDILIAAIALMWVSAIFSAFIDNIPFTVAMIPVILGIEAQGVNVMPLWWGLALGVGLGANGSHLGSTVNIFVMTLSEKMAKREDKPHLAITPGKWLRKGMPAMTAALIVSSIMLWAFFDFFNTPVGSKAEAAKPVMEATLH